MKSYLRLFVILTLGLALCFLVSDTLAPVNSISLSKTVIVSKYYYTVEKNGREGVVNELGQVVLPFEYSDVYILNNDGTPAAFFALPANVKTGERESADYSGFLFNLDGSALYKGTSYWAYPICDGLIELSAEKCGVVSYKGEEVIPFRYDSIELYGDYILAVSGDFYDHPGKIVDVDVYDKKGGLQKSGKLKLAYTNTDPNLIMVTDDTGEKSGLVDFNFEEVVPPVWDVLRYEGNGLYIACRGKKYGVIDDHGNVVIPVQYNDVYCSSDYGYRASTVFSAEDEDGVYLFDGSGKQLFFSDNFTFAFIENGVIIAYDKNNSHYINSEGEDIIPPALHIDADVSGLIIWDNDGDSACYTKDGVKLPLPEAENIEIISPERFIFTTKGDKREGICGADGSIIVPAEYNYLYPFYDYLNRFDEYYYLKPYDENNNLIIFATKDKGCGIIDPDDGRIVLDGFNALSYAGGGLFYADKGAVYGLVDINGVWIWQVSDYQTLMD